MYLANEAILKKPEKVNKVERSDAALRRVQIRGSADESARRDNGG
jgi:hypothetical protein